jgi:hypothetical protein
MDLVYIKNITVQSNSSNKDKLLFDFSPIRLITEWRVGEGNVPIRRVRLDCLKYNPIRLVQ